jgi:hypothetical protein
MLRASARLVRSHSHAGAPAPPAAALRALATAAPTPSADAGAGAAATAPRAAAKRVRAPSSAARAGAGVTRNARRSAEGAGGEGAVAGGGDAAATLAAGAGAAVAGAAGAAPRRGRSATAAGAAASSTPVGGEGGAGAGAGAGSLGDAHITAEEFAHAYRWLSIVLDGSCTPAVKAAAEARIFRDALLGEAALPGAPPPPPPHLPAGGEAGAPAAGAGGGADAASPAVGGSKAANAQLLVENRAVAAAVARGAPSLMTPLSLALTDVYHPRAHRLRAPRTTVVKPRPQAERARWVQPVLDAARLAWVAGEVGELSALLLDARLAYGLLHADAVAGAGGRPLDLGAPQVEPATSASAAASAAGAGGAGGAAAPAPAPGAAPSSSSSSSSSSAAATPPPATPSAYKPLAPFLRVNLAISNEAWAVLVAEAEAAARALLLIRCRAVVAQAHSGAAFAAAMRAVHKHPDPSGAATPAGRSPTPMQRRLLSLSSPAQLPPAGGVASLVPAPLLHYLAGARELLGATALLTLRMSTADMGAHAREGLDRLVRLEAGEEVAAMRAAVVAYARGAGGGGGEASGGSGGGGDGAAVAAGDALTAQLLAAYLGDARLVTAAGRANLHASGIAAQRAAEAVLGSDAASRAAPRSKATLRALEGVVKAGSGGGGEARRRARSGASPSTAAEEGGGAGARAPAVYGLHAWASVLPAAGVPLEMASAIATPSVLEAEAACVPADAAAAAAAVDAAAAALSAAERARRAAEAAALAAAGLVGAARADATRALRAARAAEVAARSALADAASAQRACAGQAATAAYTHALKSALLEVRSVRLARLLRRMAGQLGTAAGGPGGAGAGGVERPRGKDGAEVWPLADAMAFVLGQEAQQLFTAEAAGYHAMWRLLTRHAKTPEAAYAVLRTAQVAGLVAAGFSPVDALAGRATIRRLKAPVELHLLFPAASPLAEPRFQPFLDALLAPVPREEMPTAYFVIANWMHLLRPADAAERLAPLLAQLTPGAQAAGDAAAATAAAAAGTAVPAPPPAPAATPAPVDIDQWRSVIALTRDSLALLSAPPGAARARLAAAASPAAAAAAAAAAGSAPSGGMSPEERELREVLHPVLDAHPLPKMLYQLEADIGGPQGLVLAYAFRLCFLLPEKQVEHLRIILVRVCSQLQSARRLLPPGATPFTVRYDGGGEGRAFSAGARVADDVLPPLWTHMNEAHTIFGPLAFLYMPAFTHLVLHGWLTPPFLQLARDIVMGASVLTGAVMREGEAAATARLEAAAMEAEAERLAAERRAKGDGVAGEVTAAAGSAAAHASPAATAAAAAAAVLPAAQPRAATPAQVKVTVDVVRERASALLFERGAAGGAQLAHVRSGVADLVRHRAVALTLSAQPLGLAADASASGSGVEGSEADGDAAASAAAAPASSPGGPALDPMALAAQQSARREYAARAWRKQRNPAPPAQPVCVPFHFFIERRKGSEGPPADPPEWEGRNEAEAIERKVAILGVPVAEWEPMPSGSGGGGSGGGSSGAAAARRKVGSGGARGGGGEEGAAALRAAQEARARTEEATRARLAASLRHLGAVEHVELSWDLARDFEEDFMKGEMERMRSTKAMRVSRVSGVGAAVQGKGKGSGKGSGGAGGRDAPGAAAAAGGNADEDDDGADGLDDDVDGGDGFDDAPDAEGLEGEVDEEAVARRAVFGASGGEEGEGAEEEDEEGAYEAYEEGGSDGGALPPAPASASGASRASSGGWDVVVDGAPAAPPSLPPLQLASARGFATLVRLHAGGTITPALPLSLPWAAGLWPAAALARHASGVAAAAATGAGARRARGASPGSSPSPPSAFAAGSASAASRGPADGNLRPLMVGRKRPVAPGKHRVDALARLNAASELQGFAYFATPAAARAATCPALRHFGLVIDKLACPVVPAAELRTLLLRRVPRGMTHDAVLVALNFTLAGKDAGLRAVPTMRYRHNVVAETDGSMLLTFPTHADAVRAAAALRGVRWRDYGNSRGRGLVVGWATPLAYKVLSRTAQNPYRITAPSAAVTG